MTRFSLLGLCNSQPLDANNGRDIKEVPESDEPFRSCVEARDRCCLSGKEIRGPGPATPTHRHSAGIKVETPWPEWLGPDDSDDGIATTKYHSPAPARWWQLVGNWRRSEHVTRRNFVLEAVSCWRPGHFGGHPGLEGAVLGFQTRVPVKDAGARRI